MEREELEKKLAEATQAAIEANNTVDRLRSQLRAMPVSHEAEFERLRAMGFETYSDGAEKGDITVDLVQKASGAYAWEADIRLTYADDDSTFYDVPTGVGATPEEALGALRNSLMEMSAYIAEAAAKVPGGSERLPWVDPKPGDIFTAKTTLVNSDRTFEVFAASDDEVHFSEDGLEIGSVTGSVSRESFLEWSNYYDFRVVRLGGAS